MKRLNLTLLALVFSCGMSGCAGLIVGTAADVAIETAKIPFKVAGAVVAVATDEDDEDEDD